MNVPGAQSADRKAELAAIFAEASAFRRWYDRALGQVYGYLFPRCGGDASLAEELTQQTFVQAIRSRDTYDGRADPVTWLCAIARNKLADHHRNQDRDERRHLKLIVHEVATADQSPRSDIAIEEREAVMAALRQLPALQRAALVLCYADDLPVREAARILGRSEGATESLLNRGRAGFRALYEERTRG